MAGSNENYPDVMRPANTQAIRAGGGKFGGGIGQTRKPLSSINRNIVRGGGGGGSGSPYPNKRGGACLPQKHAISNKNPPLPVRRPITRKFAAQLANKQKPPLVEETKKPVQSAPITSEAEEDCIIIDAEKATDDFSVPMFVQHTEAMMDEINRMDEVEMEDLDEEPAIDIDSGDKKNPLAVVDYIDDLYSYYKKIEGSGCVSPNYMANQFDINERMRGILIDWLIEVHYKFDLMEETLYLTVNLIDRFLAVQPVVRKKLQLVGVTAMLLACKYEEVSVPVVEDLIVISDRAYTRKEVLDMEKLMANTLKFNLSVPTPYVFMRRFLKAAQSDKKLELLSFYIIELCLVEYEMLKFPPSLLAAGAIFTAQCALNRTSHWSKICEMHTDYIDFQLMECSKLMVMLHQTAVTGKLTGVFRKYNTSKYGYAAKSEPAHFLLE